MPGIAYVGGIVFMDIVLFDTRSNIKGKLFYESQTWEEFFQ